MNKITASLISLSLLFPTISFAEEHLCSDPNWVGVAQEATEVEESSLYNARITQHGLLLMGMHPEVDRSLAYRIADEMSELGIRSMISFHPLSDHLIEALRDRGIEILLQENRSRTFWPFGSGGWHEPLYLAAQEHGIHRISINCRWGVDRTGNAAAYLLSVMGLLTVEEAYNSVVNSREEDVQRLYETLRELGYNPENGISHLGINRIGRYGMKTHTSGYIDYIIDTVRAIEEHNAKEDGCK